MHTEMISGTDELAELFNVFHDGVITKASSVDQDLLLTVRISYLAQRIAPNFTTFNVRLHQVEGMSFATWPKDSAVVPEVLREVSAIFDPPLDILSGESADGHVQVVCNQPSLQTPHCGGTLSLRATSATVSDQSGKHYSLAELAALARAYWDEWSERNSKR
jgi:hypothetical protein